jgi:uncharacterized protein (TIGR02145 family)
MKHTVIFLATALLTVSVLAQAPLKLSYQAVIRNSSNQLVTTSNIGMQVSILQGSAEGTALFVERHFPSTNANGLVTIIIGTGTLVSGNLSLIDWTGGPFFLKTETDLNGGANYTISGTSQLLSVPYAFHAGSAEVLTGEIFESQISDLKNYLTEETDPMFSAWDKTTGISISENQITDLKTYLTEETDPVFSTWNKSYEDLLHRPSKISDFELDAGSDRVTNLAEPIESSDAATKAYVDLLEKKIERLIWYMEDPENRGILTDLEGNQYKTIKIGSQTWMAENLRARKYRNGDPIPTDLTGAEWEMIENGACAVYPHGEITGLNSEEQVLSAYGTLYNWYAVNDPRGLCPPGWKVPSVSDWEILSGYDLDNAGGKLKSTRTEPDPQPRWSSPNTGATDEFGFSALPGGYRSDYLGSFQAIGSSGWWWTSEPVSGGRASSFYLSNNQKNLDSYSANVREGYSVRCIKE